MSTPTALPSRIPERLQREFHKHRLSPREGQTLAAMIDGDTVKGAAVRLGVSPWTIETYTKSIRRKFGVQSMAHAISILLLGIPLSK